MNNKNIIPEGTRDLILDECNIMSFVRKKLEGVFISWGYDEVITPTLEYYQTFFRGKEVLKEEQVYKFFDTNGRILALRPDMTIPIARVIATKMREVNLPIRMRYFSNVYRVNKTFGGMKNEYRDCGIELVGCKGIDGEIEILVMALEALKSLNMPEFKLEIGNINLFNSAFDEIGLEGDDKERLAELIEAKSLIELNKFLDEINIKEEYKEFFRKLPWLFGDSSVLDDGIKLAFNDQIKTHLVYIKNIYEILKNLGYKEYITFDLGMVPRVNYYTGIIFRGYALGACKTILSGGRYDNLIKSFGRDLPAVGFSMNVDLITETLSGDIKLKKNEIVVMYGKRRLVEAIKLSNTLREENKIVKLELVEGDDSILNVIGGEEK